MFLALSLIGDFGLLMKGDTFFVFSSGFSCGHQHCCSLLRMKFMGGSSVPSIIVLIFLINLNKFSGSSANSSKRMFLYLSSS